MSVLGCRLGRGVAGRSQDGAWQWHHRQGRRAGGQRGVCGRLPPRRLPHPRSDAAFLLDGHRHEGAEAVLPSAMFALSCTSTLCIGSVLAFRDSCGFVAVFQRLHLCLGLLSSY